MAKTNAKTPAHLMHTTQLTREGVMDFNNYKPFRTREQKKQARVTAFKENGTYRSNAPRSMHPKLETLAKGVGIQ